MLQKSFDVNWRKQILAFQLLALLFTKKRRPKSGLKAAYHAQTIIGTLDETNERDLDYMLAVHTMTGYLLLLSERPKEAFDFLELSERAAQKLSNFRT